MRKLFITAALAFIVFAAFGQVRSKKQQGLVKTGIDVPTLFSGTESNTSAYVIPRANSIVPSITIGVITDPVVIINLTKDGCESLSDWDTMTIHFKKENFRWLNDSTAVYIRKP